MDHTWITRAPALPASAELLADSCHGAPEGLQPHGRPDARLLRLRQTSGETMAMSSWSSADETLKWIKLDI